MWIKICGIKSLSDAQRIAEMEPNAIGLNFYSPSSRAVAPEVAREIVGRLPANVEAVGLFVNHSLEQVRQIAEFCQLQTIQLHGDETPEFVAQLKRFHIYRAFRVGPEGLGDVAETLNTYEHLGIQLQGCLVDAHVKGAYGGTGVTAPWELIQNRWLPEWPPLILAGGLNAENVAEAIQTVRPSGVDVASGVESQPGIKDFLSVERFIQSARSAFPLLPTNCERDAI